MGHHSHPISTEREVERLTSLDAENRSGGEAASFVSKNIIEFDTKKAAELRLRLGNGW